MTASATTRGRPPGSSRQAIESIAIDLFLRDGYAQTTIGDIAAAAGVSKTSFFRYFSSKSEIVWSEFDAHTGRLQRRLSEATDEGASLDTVRNAVIDTLRVDLDANGLSLRRFRLLDSSTELRSEESEHWLSWAAAIAEFVAVRNNLDATSAVPAAIGGAVQATMLATLRGWIDRATNPEALLADLRAALVPICDALQPLVAR